MSPELVRRINELAHLAKVRDLTEEELAERAALREEYLRQFRASFRRQLEQIEFVDDTDQPLS